MKVTMKKSEIYLKAQIAVLNSNMNVFDKMAILRELMDREDVAAMNEKFEEEKANAGV